MNLRRVWTTRAIWLYFVFGTILAVFLYAVLLEPRWVARRDEHVFLKSAARLEKPIKVAVAADWHFTKRALWRVMTVEHAKTLVAHINAAKPDVILLPGDFIADSDYQATLAPNAQEEIAHVLGQLQAPLGVYAVLGNHDWWHQPQGSDGRHNQGASGGAAFTAALQVQGITVLSNLAQPLLGTDFWVAGIDDHSTGHAQSRHVHRQIPVDANVLVMMHDPAALMDFPKSKGLIVAGHTHGGQVYLPWLGALITPGAAPRSWAYGWVEPSALSNGNRAYVTSGLGVSIFPIRFNMRPEWVMFHLHSSENH